MFFSNLIRRWIHRAIKFAAVLTMCSSTTALADSEPFIIDLYMGEPVPQDVMLDDLSTVRIVYLGEIHTIARHHELQAQILRGLLDRELKLALGMEMFLTREPAHPRPMANREPERCRPDRWRWAESIGPICRITKKCLPWRGNVTSR